MIYEAVDYISNVTNRIIGGATHIPNIFEVNQKTVNSQCLLYIAKGFCYAQKQYNLITKDKNKYTSQCQIEIF